MPHRAASSSSVSSGMRQRVKLALATRFNYDVVCLDEPTANLDTNGIDWYLKLIHSLKNKTLLISSNVEHEYSICTHKIQIEQYKS